MGVPTNPTAAEAYPRVKGAMAVLRTRMQQAIVTYGSATLRSHIRVTMEQLATANALLTNAASLPGIAAYAQAQSNEPDIVAKWQAAQAAIVAAGTFITGAVVKASDGGLSEYAINSSGMPVELTYTAGQLAALIPYLQAVVNSIDAPTLTI